MRSLQDLEPTSIEYFFVIVVIAFSNMNSETNVFNTEFNGFKNSYIQCLNQMGGIGWK